MLRFPEPLTAKSSEDPNAIHQILGLKYVRRCHKINK
jgi:hypothetical protein